MKFLLDIITPERKAFSEEVDSVLVPTPGGLTGVLAHHEPLFTSLSDGEVKIASAGKEYFLAIGGGFMEVRPTGQVLILVSRAANADELNEAELKKALDSAKALVARKVTGDELAAAMMTIRRSMIELKVARKRRPSRFPGTN